MRRFIFFRVPFAWRRRFWRRAHFAYRAGQEGKEIFLEGDADVFLACDRAWMQEALDNLVKNALDHTKQGDAVWIKWKRFPTAVQIVIKDNGCGIHPEDLYHIFKRFYRSRFLKNAQGIGLGLPLAKAIVETHGGSIEADSQWGEGAVFVLHFFAAQGGGLGGATDWRKRRSPGSHASGTRCPPCRLPGFWRCRRRR